MFSRSMVRNNRGDKKMPQAYASAMGMRRSLRIILGIGIFGLLFSGYLSYQELCMAGGASVDGVTNGTIQPCPALGAPGTVFGYPACVYGFLMYLTIVIVAALGLRAKQ